jgi:hypothetical protein
MATRTRDLSIPDELDREIARESADRASTWSGVATELLEEALRMRRAPGVVLPTDPLGGGHLVDEASITIDLINLALCPSLL